MNEQADRHIMDAVALAEIRTDIAYIKKEIALLHNGITERIIQLEKKMWVVWGVGIIVIGIAIMFINNQIRDVRSLGLTEERIHKLEYPEPQP